MRVLSNWQKLKWASFVTIPSFISIGHPHFLKRSDASTKHHSQHYRHQLHTLDDVDVWLDLRVPLLETLASRLWKIALTKYVPGQTNMTGYISRAGSLIACLVFLINPVIYVAVFLKWFD